MKIVKSGTTIITKIGKIKALITGVCIRGENMYYEISYFVNGDQKTCWLYRFEFDIDSSQSKKAGLVNYEPIESENIEFLTT